MLLKVSAKSVAKEVISTRVPGPKKDSSKQEQQVACAIPVRVVSRGLLNGIVLVITNVKLPEVFVDMTKVDFSSEDVKLVVLGGLIDDY